LAKSFLADPYFSFDSCLNQYIFVSKHSLESACEKYPFIRRKSVCIYNISDTEQIKRLASETVEETYFQNKLPVILTCANIRAEKNHLRQLKAMKILKDEGIEFIWLNVGSTADKVRTAELRARAKRYGLEDRFLVVGPSENPYHYIAHADAVAVLSDYESWSMVITEAKILGVPVIATRTSGALEQIENRTNGILCDFTAEDIAEKIKVFLQLQDLQIHIRRNIANFDNTEEILRSFDELVSTQDRPEDVREKALYVIDNINYNGGAHIATRAQIQNLLRKGHDITIFSGDIPSADVRTELNGVHFIGWGDCLENQIYHRRLLDCWTDTQLSKEMKKYKTKLTWEGKIRRNPNLFQELVLPCLSNLFSKFDIICVMSEGSGFREAAAASGCKRKIQYIHTDYAAWRIMAEWNRQITAKDRDLYQHFDKIVLLSETIREGFTALYPHLKEKTVVNQNLMPVETILEKAQEPERKGTPAHFVTVARIDRCKGIDRIYNALTKLYNSGYRFTWTIVGDGEELAAMKSLFAASDFHELVEIVGARSNPFQIMKKADVFALFSRYEGLPNTIYEAFILGIPVISTDVGGISSQIEDGVNGWLVENDDDAIYEGIKHILLHPEEIAQFKENLKGYQYKNQEIANRTETILFGPEVS